MSISIEKRFLSLFLAFALVFSLLPWTAIEASAADEEFTAVLGTDSAGGSANDGYTLSGDTLTICATTTAVSGDYCGGTTYTQHTTTVVLKNNTGSPVELTFAGAWENEGSATIQSTTYYSGMSVNVDNGASITISVSSKDQTKNTTKLTLKMTHSVSNAVIITFAPAENGDYTVNGENISSSIKKEGTAATQYSVKATAADGYQFFGWYNETKSQYMSYNAETNLQMSENATVYPKFIKSTAAKFGVGTQQFFDLTAACAAAQSGTDKTVVLLNNGTLPAGDYTIPSGVTLLIPYNDANTLCTTKPTTIESSTYVAPTAYRTLTMASGANLVVNGAMSISAVMNTATPAPGAVRDKVGFVRMESGSNITINNGGKLYAWGYVAGSGSVTVKNGGMVYENFQVGDFKGGSNTSELVGNSQGVFPFNHYYIQNIEVSMTLEAGAIENGYMAVNITMAGIQGSEVPFIGPDGMFNIKSGHIVKDYDETNKRLVISVAGEVEMKSLTISMKLSLLGTKTINSSQYVLPITSSLTVRVKDGGKVTVTQNLCMIPGSQLYVEEGADVTMGSGNYIIFYDEDNWGGYSYGLARHYPIKSTSSGAGPTLEAYNKKDKGDAFAYIEGTLDASAGFVYTTSGGAAITAAEGAKVILQPGALTATYQYQMEGSDGKTLKAYEIPITPAKLKNADETYLETANCKDSEGNYLKNSYTYNSTTGKWECYKYDDTCNGHIYTSEVIAPTCTEQGYTTHTCSVCGDSYKDTYVNATGHNPNTDDGNCATAINCSVCGTETTAAKTHVWGIAVADGKHACTNAGCRQTTLCTDGADADHKCDLGCGTDNLTQHVYTLDTSAGENGYTWSANGKSCTAHGKCACGATTTVTAAITSAVKTAATCVAMGTTTYTATFTETWASTRTKDVQDIAMLTHSYTGAIKSDGDGKEATHSYQCVNGCGKYGGAETHTWNGGAVTTNPNCESKGERIYTCTADGCGATYTEEIAANGHSYGEWIVEVPATCEGTGTKGHYTCSVCSKHFDDHKAELTDLTIPALGHKDENPKDHECDNGCDVNQGEHADSDTDNDHKCDYCKQEMGEHIYSTQVTEPTCERGGYTTYTCNCGDSYQANQTEQLAHKDTTNDHYCDNGCKAKISECADSDDEDHRCDTCNALLAVEITFVGHVTNQKVVVPVTANYSYTLELKPCFHLVEDATYNATYRVMCGSERIFPTENNDGTYTIPKDELTGNIVITVYTEQIHEGDKNNDHACDTCGEETSDCAGNLHTIEAKNPTCTEAGNSEYYTCGICGKYYSDSSAATEVEKDSWIIPALGHTAGAEATCTEDQTCTVCSAVLTEKLGHDEEAHEAKAPTCTENGWDAYVTCSRCDYTTYVEKVALGHEMVGGESKAPTCTEAGFKSHKCTRCDYTETVYTDPTGHNWTQETCSTPKTCVNCGITEGTVKNHSWGEIIVVTQPTCTQDGVNKVVCADCGAVSHLPVAALGHKEVSYEAQNPTCTEIGWDAYVTCSRCDYSTYVEKAALGHKYEAVVTAPTCTEDGYTTYTCSACGDTYKADEVAALGHTPGAEATCTTAQTCTVCGVELNPALGHKYEAVVTAPTCTEDGYTTYTCSACGDTYKADEVAALGHTPGAEATCTTAQTCTVCGVELNPALGHDEVSHEAQAPTCTEIGWDAYVTCSRCDYTTYVEKAELGHTPGAEATCTTAQTCTACGVELNPALGHKYEAVVTAPTCTEDGYTTYTCSVCCDTYIDDEVNALGHTEGEVKFRWNFINPTGTAYWDCETCGVRFDLETVTTSETTAGDCQTRAQTVYTATAVYKEQTYTSTYIKTGNYGAHTHKAYGYDANGHWSICQLCGEKFGEADHEESCSCGRIVVDCAESIGYTGHGNVITVKYDLACKAGYIKDGKYVEIPAQKNEDGTYSFIVPGQVAAVAIVVIGDTDGDGDLDMDDKEALEALLAGAEATDLQLFTADINGNGVVNSADRILLAQALLSKDHRFYKPIAWNTGDEV